MSVREENDDESFMANDPLSWMKRPPVCKRWFERMTPGHGRTCGGEIKLERDGTYRCQECRHDYGT